LTAIVIGGLALAGNVLRAASPRESTPLGLEQVSVAPAGRFSAHTLDRDFLNTLRAREVVYRTYDGSEGEPVWLFLGYFDRQKEGSQVHSPRHCYPGSGWNIESEPRWAAPWGDGTVASLVVSDGNERRLVVYWYQLEGKTETGVFALKFAMTRRALLRQPQDVVFASVSTPVTADLDDAMRRIAPVARDTHTQIDQLYGERHGYRTGN